MSQNNAPARKARITAADVALLMFGAPSVAAGIGQVRTLHERDGIASATFDKAVEMLSADTAKASALAALADECHPAGTGERGRPAARVGDTRAYRAQQVGDDGDVFVRLPVGLLGARKGQSVAVTFLDGAINVRLS